MAFIISVQHPTKGHVLTYLKFTKFLENDPQSRTLSLQAIAYKDKSFKEGESAGDVTFKFNAFDRYFSKPALDAAAAANRSNWKIAYLAVRDLASAMRAFRQYSAAVAAAHAAGQPPPAALDPQIVELATQAGLRNDYGNEDLFLNAADDV